MEPPNVSAVTEFQLLGFQNLLEWQSLLFAIFLFIYVLTVLGNVVIIAVASHDRRLHTPMYTLLKHLSFLEVWYTSTVAPPLLASLLSWGRAISFPACMAQLYFFVFFGATECFLLATMAYDRYLAICSPLRYSLLMSPEACAKLVAVSWLGGGLYAVMHTAGTFSLSYCGSNVVRQFFCDVPQLLVISCSGNLMNELVPIVISVVLSICYFMCIVFSYVHIFSAVRKIPSTEGQAKAYSTCLPHLLVVVLFLLTSFFAYLKPTSETPSASDLVISMFYTMVPPTFNPVIYSLRNQAMKSAVGRLLRGRLTSTIVCKVKGARLQLRLPVLSALIPTLSSGSCGAPVGQTRVASVAEFQEGGDSFTVTTDRCGFGSHTAPKDAPPR
ncbi:PREDICTED: olfactory receptor 14A16-like [Condylura cristata]|uniref:olfactory receptor 14A16-like n=1 Tax=Condylura cristata TaxID=143302 RepID=UPI0006438DCD|nr:PREDICTED: olfactory receptor 14A16-like [Condylura cristata]